MPVPEDEPFIEFEYERRRVLMPETRGLLSKRHKRGVFYEMEMLEAIKDLDLKGTYIDVGANIGNHTLFFEMFCPSTRVIAFEPHHIAWSLLMKTRDLNELEFEAHNVGLSDDRGFAETKKDQGTYSFPVLPLDELGLTDVAVVKIDIEGMEPEALRGMQGILENMHPPPPPPPAPVY